MTAMPQLAQPAMNWFRSWYDFAAMHMSQSLHAKADTQYGDGLRLLKEKVADACKATC